MNYYNLTESEQYLLYELLREKFDSNVGFAYDASVDMTLITIASKLDLPMLSQQMQKDAEFGKENIPQPPAGCITKQEWLKKIQGA